ncbi:TetR/AcrR family transcriptional regulator [Marinitenerispora sediminis]|uniref:TetR family transcriptional regulator n=1 Tax=Marinitenerispora sediminis TaxID=1931232 RepID=A0A368T2V8_9ACTN|nr:TetR/AcrR family transcriptional regulator [Marinitenerispora sediminis]RCV49187.1 TetR family transcriptional regulator [Marinitenerispora sediminis]RCV51998.1 TetR family transcriptional regulator [Marinitenerispora sediminis]RCV56057.1 TetR family transcriptional regulator [Marinitenerispora sediminis]
MGRLSRAQTQERNRARVLRAARAEFAERGFRDAKIDAIAERAELTRGAVYSNFPGKRALYFTVLAEDTERAAEPPGTEPGGTPREALGAFARAWVARLPLASDQQHGAARLGVDLLPEVLADERTRLPFTQLMKLDALLLGLALERLRSPAPAPAPRMVRVAEAALTTLHGASQLAAAAPGFVEPFDVVRACERLADLDLGDGWPPPHTAHIRAQTRSADEPWSPPPAVDAVRGGPASLTGDGVVAVLGLHRISAVEEAVRAAPPEADVTAVLVTGTPGELAPLARLAVAEAVGCLRAAFPRSAWPRLRVVHDGSGTIAAAAGVPAVSDATETAVRVSGGRITARADGYGACHAAALAERGTGVSGARWPSGGGA